MIVLLLELVAVVAIALLTGWGVTEAVETALTQASGRTGELILTEAEVRAAATRAWLFTCLGIGAMAVGRLVGVARRGRTSIAAPLLVPAAAAVAGLGLCLQVGYGDPLHGEGWAGPAFGQAVAGGGIGAALAMALPWDPGRWIRKLKWPLLGSVGLVFALLATPLGEGPGDTKINLFGFQPLELVKPAFAAFLAAVLGGRAAELRWHRNKLSRWPLVGSIPGLRELPVPRLRWLLPGIGALLLIFFGLAVVKDLGPILVLALLFVALYHVTTRSPLEVLLVMGLVVGATVLLFLFPDHAPGLAPTRIKMMAEPWTNGDPYGTQLAQALWAFGAGGWSGQGLGGAAIGALPAGHNDLVLAHLAEELGAVGMFGWLAAFGALVLQGIWIGAWGRTPERQLLAGGLASLLFVQAVVIFCGVVGWLPLTGIVTPLLSSGRTSVAVMLLLIGVLGRLAVDGRPSVADDELSQLRRGFGELATVVTLGLIIAGWISFDLGVVRGPKHVAMPLITVGADGGLLLKYDRRLEAVARAIPRGELRDRAGVPLATTDSDGGRRYPLGADLGTLLGWEDPASLRMRPPWALERAFEWRLRGLETTEPSLGVWVYGTGPRPTLALAVPHGEPRDIDRVRAEAHSQGEAVRFIPVGTVDRSSLIPLVRTRPEARAEALTRLEADVDARSVSLTLDSALQVRAAEELRRIVEADKPAAVVVIDVDTGEVLARAQVPDFDPADDGWMARLDARDPTFVGVYGAYPDKTGLRGFWQSGSIAKVYTALAAARSGALVPIGENCDARSEGTHSCVLSDADGPYFTRDGWVRPIHDYHGDANHGDVDVSSGLQVSCNVFFGQLGLELGPDPLKDLHTAGLDMGWNDELRPGAGGSRLLGSTAFGQGAAALSPSQAARIAATVAAGGVLRRCPANHELGAECEEIVVVDDAGRVAPIIAGMRRVMQPRGTGRSLREPPGLRVYGKTGTADDPINVDEQPFGLGPSAPAVPHSWFIGFAEPESSDPCGAHTPGRIAIAVVVPRGGMGSGRAARAAMRILGAAQELGYLGGPTP